MNTDERNNEIAAEAAEQWCKYVETDGPPLDPMEKAVLVEFVTSAIEKAYPELCTKIAMAAKLQRLTEDNLVRYMEAQSADTKRLDWLEKTKCEIVIGEDWPAYSGEFKTISEATIREAIDAAMKK